MDSKHIVNQQIKKEGLEKREILTWIISLARYCNG
jgi:hypothetical protein